MNKITIIFLSFLLPLFSCNDKPDTKDYSKKTDNTALSINYSYQSIYNYFNSKVDQYMLGLVGY